MGSNPIKDIFGLKKFLEFRCHFIGFKNKNKKLYLSIVFLTLISSLSVGFFGRFLGFYGAAIFSTSCLVLAFLVSLFIFYEVAFVGCFSYINCNLWISSEVLNVDWGFMFDSFTSITVSYTHLTLPTIYSV